MGIDVVAGILLLYMALRAFRQGFARQLIQLTGLALGVTFAESAAETAAPQLRPLLTAIPLAIHDPSLVLAAMFFIWLSVSVIGSFYLAGYRKRMYGENVPSLGDSLFGVAIGGVKAAFLVSLAVFGFDQLPEGFRKLPPIEDQILDSKSVKTAREFRLVERLIDAREVQAIGARVQQLIEYFRRQGLPAAEAAKAPIPGPISRTENGPPPPPAAAS